MCFKHWRMVPKPVQDLIWKHYRKGQELDKRPSLSYICTAFVSVSTVALQEGQPLPSMDAYRKEDEAHLEPLNIVGMTYNCEACGLGFGDAAELADHQETCIG